MHKVGDPIWTESRIGDIGFITHVFPYSGVVYVRFMRDDARLTRVSFEDVRIPHRFGNIIPMDQRDLIVPDLPEDFFDNPILTKAGENLIDKVQSEREGINMCKDPINPNLPNWRRPKEPKQATAETLVGEELEAARRAQAVSDAAFKGLRKVATTTEELEDWKVYDKYYWKVGSELSFNRHPEMVTAHDISEEVRKRLAKGTNEEK